MTTAVAPVEQDQHASTWQLLRQWMDAANRRSMDLPATLTRKQLAPMIRWIFVLEFLLRRLVLLAAIAYLASAPAKPVSQYNQGKGYYAVFFADPDGLKLEYVWTP